MNYVTIDFEASCLPRHGRSFPIEVGIAGHEGARSWLIRPITGADRWDWTLEAAALHRIDPRELDRDGLPPHRAYAELSRAIDGRRVVADSILDAYWWSLLAGVAGEEADNRIVPVGALFDEWGVSTEDIMAAQRHADALCPGRHRAADDARWLWTVLTTLERTKVDSFWNASAVASIAGRRPIRSRPHRQTSF